MLSPKNISYFLQILLVTSLAIINISCDNGITPFPETISSLTGFEGEVTFIGNWPDGILQTYLVVFKEPLKSAADFPPPNLSYIIGPIAFGSKEYSYNSIDNSFSSNFKLVPGTYNYLVVVQSKKANLSLNLSDWTIVGIYYSKNETTTPGSLTIVNGKIIKDINIICDFSKLPPQANRNNKNEYE